MSFLNENINNCLLLLMLKKLLLQNFAQTLSLGTY